MKTMDCVLKTLEPIPGRSQFFLFLDSFLHVASRLGDATSQDGRSARAATGDSGKGAGPVTVGLTRMSLKCYS